MRTILILIVLSLILLSGCSTLEDIGDTGITISYECKSICESHNWNYASKDWKGYGRTVCYCTDKEGAIWVFNI